MFGFRFKLKLELFFADLAERLSVLSLQGCSAAVLTSLKMAPMSSGFARPVLPKLSVLDLSWVSGINDVLLEKSVLHTPASRLSHLKQLALAGSDIGDRSLSALPASFPHLEQLCLAYCMQFSAKALHEALTTVTTVASVATETPALLARLRRLDLTGCSQLCEDFINFERRLRQARPSLQLHADFTTNSKPVHQCLDLK